VRGVHPSLKIALTDGERAFLEEQVSRRIAPYVEVVRAKAILMAAAGARNVEIAEKVDVDPRTVSIWRKDFLERRCDSLSDRPRSGRRRSFSP